MKDPDYYGQKIYALVPLEDRHEAHRLLAHYRNALGNERSTQKARIAELEAERTGECGPNWSLLFLALSSLLPKHSNLAGDCREEALRLRKPIKVREGEG